VVTLGKQGCSMSIASELLHSTSKRVNKPGGRIKEFDPLQRLVALDNVVYGLISEHEPSGGTADMLRADLKIMHLSGLVDRQSDTVVTRVCKQAAQVMAELIRVLPRER